MIGPKRRSRAETQRARELRKTVSKTERRLWPHLRDGQMGASFRRQHPIAGFYLDYYCAQLKLAVEVDGPGHDVVRDSQRDATLAQHGVETLRFSAQELDRNLRGVVETIWREVSLRLAAREEARKSLRGETPT